jgi:NAD(P)-dependent dehydrogenase (short-subunit alcohol dehydrogenase family)
MLMQILAEELIDQGIVINELIPGPVNTNIDNDILCQKLCRSVTAEPVWDCNR